MNVNEIEPFFLQCIKLTRKLVSQNRIHKPIKLPPGGWLKKKIEKGACSHCTHELCVTSEINKKAVIVCIIRSVNGMEKTTEYSECIIKNSVRGVIKIGTSIFKCKGYKFK